MIAVVDYGAGNLFSVSNALTYLSIPHEITSDPAAIEAADGILLPGVGAFPDAMRMLREKNLVSVLQTQAEQKPFLGICLGMQLLFETGYEFEETAGLGLIPGSVQRITDCGLKIPHMGWNALRFENPCPLLEQVPEQAYVYFVHSYRADCDTRYIAAYAEYGEKIPALVCKGHIFGAQFHPEKSADHGLMMLKNFAALCR